MCVTGSSSDHNADLITAINKPKSVSSAQVLRDIQLAFDPSNLFAPWIHAERTKRDKEPAAEKRRRRNKRIQVKVGHGGTLDPMATGVLIVGVGKGTKHLQNFLSCTKTYEATVLFGAATDTYDALGKILNKAPYAHVTRTVVEEALKKFRGPIKQRPPLYSALRMNGKRLYEYAREGKEIPREIEERPVTTESLEMREWLPGGSHEYTWPEGEAGEEEKEVAEKVLDLGAPLGNAENKAKGKSSDTSDLHGKKRQRDSEAEDDELNATNPAAKRQELSPDPAVSEALQGVPKVIEEVPSSALDPEAGAQTCLNQKTTDDGPPAAKLSMTVTSGFYVRSLCHDLGRAVGSLGIMSELVRTRQAGFLLGRNVLEYEDLSKGEDVWAPKVEHLLDEWKNELASKSDIKPPSS
ncbi:MAG: hypothetical protein L6R41_007686 [Letrouitia leprolyta]|nr:MAG: hypothetical protein L6R41_007686 [Letrouitia leprolyta]